jgi:hypothetical protein
MGYRRLNLAWGTGSITPALVADTFRTRLVGLRARGVGGLVIDARTVHTIGFRRPITVLETTLFGRVVAATTVPPNRLYRRRYGGVLVEIADIAAAPAVGQRLVALACTDDARHPHPLRNPDRKPR